jgi:hypothetical protein
LESVGKVVVFGSLLWLVGNLRSARRNFCCGNLRLARRKLLLGSNGLRRARRNLHGWPVLRGFAGVEFRLEILEKGLPFEVICESPAESRLRGAICLFVEFL